MLCTVCLKAFREDSETPTSATSSTDLSLSPTISRRDTSSSSSPTAASPFFKATHHTLFQLRDSAKEGCRLCTLLWNKAPGSARDLVDEVQQNSRREVWLPCHFTVDRAIFRGEESRKILFEYKYETVDVPPADYVLPPKQHLRLLRSEEAEQLINREDIGSYTGSAESWNAAAGWLWQCLEHHPLCKRRHIQSHQTQLPTRLLDIGTRDAVSSVKLCLVQNLPQDVQYIALSHCWGLGPRFRLTTSSAGTFYEGIEVSALPKTFQDTIAVATKFRAEFGIRYVWIDSLCIVQDSLEDWRRESAIMGEIYQNAFCTVAATAAVDGSIGLFFQRQTWRILPCAIPVVPEDGAERMFYWTDPDDWTNSVSKAPLNQRSWVLQERLLSPRVLHFAADQLFWECSGLEASEVFPRGLPEGLGEQYKQWLRLVGTITVKDLRGTLRGAYGIWDQIVKTYSAGNLTEPTDRLVALSGIAHKMQEHLLPFDSYAAGLWRNDIPFGLLWDVKDPLKQDQSSNLVQHYIAPSWSWASRSGIVPGDVDPWASARSLINIKWARISAIGHDEMGQLNGGTIGLSCILIRAHLSRVYQPGSSAPGSALRLGRRLIGGAICRADEGFRFDVHLPTILYCLPIFQASGKYVTRCRGLLLIPSGRTREFRRYGTFTADAWNEEFLKSSDPHMFETGDLSANGRFDIMLI